MNSDMEPVRNVLLLHGLLNDSALWSGQRAALGKDAVVMTPEFSSASSLPLLAAEVLADAPARFALAGFSMGGYVALEILRQAPERVEGIALLASSALSDTQAQRSARLATVAALEAGKFPKIVDSIARNAVFPQGDHAEVARDAFVAMAHRVGPQKFIAHLQALTARRSHIDALSAVRCPALVISGACDSVVAPAATAETAAAMPHARLEFIERTGHLLPLEAPQRVSGLLLDWLRQVRRGPR